MTAGAPGGSVSREERVALAHEMIAHYIKAEKAVLSNQAYSIGGQSLTRADLDKIRSGRREWEQALEALLYPEGKRRFRRMQIVDD